MPSPLRNGLISGGFKPQHTVTIISSILTYGVERMAGKRKDKVRIVQLEEIQWQITICQLTYWAAHTTKSGPPEARMYCQPSP